MVLHGWQRPKEPNRGQNTARGVFNCNFPVKGVARPGEPCHSPSSGTQGKFSRRHPKSLLQLKGLSGLGVGAPALVSSGLSRLGTGSEGADTLLTRAPERLHSKSLT
jgi:hypothetical protein